MKKNLICALLSAAMFFVTGCGGGSDSVYDEQNDSGEQSSSDSDSAELSDSDNGNAADTGENDIPDSGTDQEIPDGRDEGKESGEKPCKDANPCDEIPNSTGECKIKNNDYICGCEENYTWNGEFCMANSRSAKCSGLPENAEWNTVSEIIQVWNGEKWIPSKEGSYCENESESECCFKCKKNHHWVDSTCLPECSPTSATPCIDLNTELIWSAKSENTMHWNDTFEYCANVNAGGFDDWKMPSVKVLNTLVRNCDSASGCEGNTDGLYSEFGEISVLWSSSSLDSSNALGVNFLDGSTVTKSTDESFYVRCVRGNLTTRTVKCKLEQEHAEINRFTKIEQTWDWNDMWVPSNTAVFNEESKEGECRFKCDEGYGFNGSVCVDKEGYAVCDGAPESFPCKDLKTGKIWSGASTDTYEWGITSYAGKFCSDLTLGGFTDWRLPDIDELRSTIRNCPATQTGGKCGLTTSCLSSDCRVKDDCHCDSNDTQGYYSILGFSKNYWSSNTTSNGSSYAWYVDFADAGLYYTEYDPFGSNPTKKVVCVRN